MMVAMLVAALATALASAGPADAQAQKPKTAISSKPKNTSGKPAVAPVRPAGTSAAEQSAFDRAAQSYH